MFVPLQIATKFARLSTIQKLMDRTLENSADEITTTTIEKAITK